MNIIEILKQFGAVIAISLTVVAIVIVIILFIVEIRKDFKL